MNPPSTDRKAEPSADDSDNDNVIKELKSKLRDYEPPMIKRLDLEPLLALGSGEPPGGVPPSGSPNVYG